MSDSKGKPPGKHRSRRKSTVRIGGISQSNFANSSMNERQRQRQQPDQGGSEERAQLGETAKQRAKKQGDKGKRGEQEGR